MTDKKTTASKANLQPAQKTNRLWPALTTIIAYPIFLILALALLLWLIHLFNPPYWLAWSGVFLIPLIGVYVTWRLMSAWAKRSFRFSLRGMLVAMTAIAIVIGIVGKISLQRMAVMEVAANGAYPENWTDKEKNWLQAKFRYDPFDKVRSLNVRSDQAIPILLKHPEAFPELEFLSFSRGSSDAALQDAVEFNKFPHLKGAAFYRGIPSDKGIEQIGKWTQVRNLHFNSSAITDKGLARLTILPELETLSLTGDNVPGMLITDNGLKYVGKLTHLKKLVLFGLSITDNGLEELQNLVGLEKLYIRRTNATEAGIEKLSEALPDCWISDDFTHFPLPSRIRQITVTQEAPNRRQLLTISNPIQVAEIMEHLENLLKKYQGGWNREWNSKAPENLSLDLEGANRCLGQVSFEDAFLYNGGLRHALSRPDAIKLRLLLGIDSTLE